MKDNRGLTLVELLISLAILSIVLVMATAFMVTGSNTFAKGSADSKVQKEAELAVNQIGDMIIDVNGGVDMAVDTADRKELVLYNAGSGSSIANTKEVIAWDSSDESIRCSKWNVIYDISTDSYTVDGTALYENQLLAEHVEGFEVDLSDAYTEKLSDGTEVEIVKSVSVKVAYTDGNGKASYATSPIITLRNRMMKSPSPTLIFNNTPDTTDTLKLYISDTTEAAAVPIQDRVTTVERNKVYHIFAMIDSGNSVNDLVDWEIEETNSLSTISGSGQLSVGEFEPNTYLTITAKYKSNPSKKATGVVKVIGGTLKSLDAAKIIAKELLPFAPKYGSFVTTTGFTDADTANLQYKWTINEPDRVESFADSGSTLNLTVRQAPENYKKVIVISLTVYSPTTGQTVSDSVTYRIDDEGTTDGDANMERGRTGNITYLKYAVPNWSLGWSCDYYFCDVYGNRISELEHLKQYVTLNENILSGFGFSIDEGLPADHDYYVKIEVYVWPTEGYQTWEPWDYERIIYIPAVQMYGKTISYQSDNAWTSYELQYGMSGYYGYSWQSSQPYTIEVEDFQYEAPEGIIVTPSFNSSYWVSNANNLLGITVGFEANGDKGQVKLKSLTVKISFKDMPDIYAYSTLLFGQEN